MNRCLKILGIIVVSILLTGTTQSSDDSVPNELELVWSYKTSSNVESVSISADGSYTAVGSGDKVYLLDRDGKVLWSYETNFPVKYVSISANGNYTAVGDAGKSYPIPKGKAYFLNKEGDLLGTVEGNAVSSVSISEDGSRALTYMHGLGWWDIVIFYPSENETKSWHYTIGWAKTGAVSISENGNYIAVGSAGQGLEKEGIRFYNREGKLLWKYKDIDTGYEPHYSVSISADGSYIIAGNDKNDKVYLLDRDGKLLWSYKTGFVEGISISVDGSYMAVGSGDKVYLLDRNGKFLWSHDINGISSVSISTDGNSIVVGSRDKIVYLFLKVQILAQRTIKNSYEVISQEKSKGVNVKEAETLLYQAENAFKKGDYSKAKEVAKQAESKALEIGKEADDANSLISKAKFAISQEKSKGLIITEAESLLSQAENSFKADDYYKAKKLAEQARDKALEISSTNLFLCCRVFLIFNFQVPIFNEF
ncbi:MAG: PQQ-binding-like beta-propeller repeat protein [Candidatus Altiarchaeales archaeon]|nr:PQQ-binding-like beta-propeller repeat protein [Candidatus Altiarchaeota archaeon]MCG2782367.1 PQQ-binding-like beta-propeller repeat protein [Candidatus Altiarchaeales archaeon]